MEKLSHPSCLPCITHLNFNTCKPGKKIMKIPFDDKEAKSENRSGVDKGLFAMFLRMSPEERLRANDNALRAILELRDAYRQARTKKRRSKRDS